MDSGQVWIDPLVKQRLRSHMAKMNSEGRRSKGATYADAVEHLLDCYDELARLLAHPDDEGQTT